MENSEKEAKVKFCTNRLMEILENPKYEDFCKISDLDDNLSGIGILVYIDQCLKT